MSELNSALFHLDPPEDRMEWFKLLAAFKAGDGDLETALAWSEQGSNFTREGFDSTWRSIKPGGYGVATLYYMARQAGWTPSHHVPIPERKPVPEHPVSKGPNPSYKKAKEFWAKGTSEGVERHPYCWRKKITHAFGARAATISQRDLGSNAECLLIPQKDWADRLVGVEAINADGLKRTFGNRGHLILGHPEGSQYIHVAEGWASLWAIFKMFPRPLGGICVFGKHALQRVADEGAQRYAGQVIVHGEQGKRDAWDVWQAGDAEKYVATVMGAING